MTTAIRQIKYDLENSSENLENKRVEYNSWNSIKDELDRVRVKAHRTDSVLLMNYCFYLEFARSASFDSLFHFHFLR